MTDSVARSSSRDGNDEGREPTSARRRRRFAGGGVGSSLLALTSLRLSLDLTSLLPVSALTRRDTIRRQQLGPGLYAQALWLPPPPSRRHSDPSRGAARTSESLPSEGMTQRPGVVLSGSEDGRPPPYRLAALLRGHANDVRAVASSSSSSHLFTASRDGSARSWCRGAEDGEQGGGWKEERVWQDGHEGYLNALSFVPPTLGDPDKHGTLRTNVLPVPRD